MAAELAFLYSFPPDKGAQELSPVDYDSQMRTFLQRLNSIPAGIWAKGEIDKQDILEILNPAINSIPYLYLLVHQVSSHVDRAKTPQQLPETVCPQGQLWSRMIEFLRQFDPVQIRYVGADWRKLVELVDKIVHITNTPALGIVPIRTALSRMDPSLGTFTSLHLLYLRLCHEVRAYYEALPVLDKYIYSFPTTPVQGGEYTFPCADHFDSSSYITTRSGLSDKVTASDVQEYFMLGANAYLALRQYKQAQLLLECIITTPSQNLASGLMAEAYKKLILVGCLVDGAVAQSLKAANSQALKAARATSRAYEAISEIFNTADAARLHAEIDAGAQLWDEDGNTGLVREVLQHHSRVFVRNLSRTFAAAPISTIAKWLGQKPAAAETYIKALIDDGFLNATIEHDQGTSVLQFHSELTGPRARTEEQQLADLMAQTKRTNDLVEHVKVVQTRLTLQKEYVDFARRKLRQKESADQTIGETMDTTWETFEQDEDVMGDL